MRLLLVVLAVFVLALLGCDPCYQVMCGACLPPVTLEVLDVQGDLVESATSSTPGFTCSGGWCSGGSAAGTYVVTVEAEGHEPRSVEVTTLAVEATGCCGCNYEARTLQITLSVS